MIGSGKELLHVEEPLVHLDERGRRQQREDFHLCLPGRQWLWSRSELTQKVVLPHYSTSAGIRVVTHHIAEAADVLQ